MDISYCNSGGQCQCGYFGASSPVQAKQNPCHLQYFSKTVHNYSTWCCLTLSDLTGGLNKVQNLWNIEPALTVTNSRLEKRCADSLSAVAQVTQLEIMRLWILKNSPAVLLENPFWEYPIIVNHRKIKISTVQYDDINNLLRWRYSDVLNESWCESDWVSSTSN